MSKQKISSVLLSFSLILAVSTYEGGKTYPMVTSHTTNLYVPDMRQWGPEYANYYLGDKMKAVYFGPGYAFDQQSFWRTKLAPHSGFMHRNSDGFIYDKSAVELDRIHQ